MPLLSETITGALVLPDEGIIDPVRLVCGYGELAATNGARIALDCAATGIELHDGRIAAVQTTRGTVGCRYLVNAAGMGAGVISELGGGEPLHPTPRQGQYWILDRAFGARMSRIVLPVPMAETHGVQVVPTTNGSMLLGPSAEDIDDEQDTGNCGGGRIANRGKVKALTRCVGSQKPCYPPGVRQLVHELAGQPGLTQPARAEDEKSPNRSEGAAPSGQLR